MPVSSGNPISEVNLTKWKQGGFLEWKTHQDSGCRTLPNPRRDGRELADVAASVADDLEALVLARYKATVHGATGEISAAAGIAAEVHEQIFARPGGVPSLPQRGRSGRRFSGRRWTWKRQKTEEGQRKVFLELARDRKIQDKLTPKMTPEEKAAAISKILFPNGL